VFKDMADEMVPNLNVFGTLIIGRVFRNCESSLVIVMNLAQAAIVGPPSVLKVYELMLQAKIPENHDHLEVVCQEP
jgi:hypothetical protein